MFTIEGLANFLYSLYNFSSQATRALQSTVAAIIRVNYNAVTFMIESITFAGTLLRNLLQGIYYVIVVLASAVFDFIFECYNFMHAFILLLWKFVLLIISVLDVLFRGIEQLAYFIWSGGTWTAGALKISLTNLKDSSSSMFSFSDQFIRQLFISCGNGITAFGTLTVNSVSFIFSSVKWIVTGSFTFLDNAMMWVADSIRYVVDAVYFFFVDAIIRTPKETYYGIMMLLLMYFLIINLYGALFNRGMTFPFMPENYTDAQHRHRAAFHGRNEFSDDEMTQSENDDASDTDSNVTIEEFDDDDDDSEMNSDEEFSVIDDSDDNDDDQLSDVGSDAESQISDIDVQLPRQDEGRYNFRRSATPNRSRVSSPEEYDKELEKEREKNMCVVCQDNKKSVLILPCKHMCLCVDCGHRIVRQRAGNRRTCPLCRQKIRTIMNVYV